MFMGGLMHGGPNFQGPCAPVHGRRSRWTWYGKGSPSPVKGFKLSPLTFLETEMSAGAF